MAFDACCTRELLVVDQDHGGDLVYIEWILGWPSQILEIKFGVG
jgi:hypothetical protein